MDVTVEMVDGITVVVFQGEVLDAGNVGRFRREMASHIEAWTHVIFDLRYLQFVDSSGLGAILSCLRQLRSTDGELKLCEMSNSVRILFELVRMHRILEIFDTREEAVQSFQDVYQVV